MDKITPRNGIKSRAITPRQFCPSTAACNLGFMGWRERFKERWEEMRREGITQDDLAEAVGVTQGTIAHWLNGRRSPKALEDYERLAQGLGKHPAWLLYGIEPESGLSKDAATLAKEWEQLPPGQRAAMKEAVHSLASTSGQGEVNDPRQ